MSEGSYELSGKVHRVSETKVMSERFSKREFIVVLDPDSKYPQYVQLEASGDRCSLLDGINVGDEVKVDFNLRGREWKSPAGEVKYFTTISAWKLVATKRAVVAAGSLAEGDIPFASCDAAHEPNPIARVLR